MDKDSNNQHDNEGESFHNILDYDDDDDDDDKSYIKSVKTGVTAYSFITR